MGSFLTNLFYCGSKRCLFTLLSAYIYILNYKESIVKQIRRSRNALMNSFKKENVCFYEDDGKYTIFVGVPGQNPIVTYGMCSWIYVPHKKTFAEISSGEKVIKSIPQIGATISYSVTNELVADMSEWLSDINYLSLNSVPPQLLLAGWSYDTGVPIYEFKLYILRLTDLFGNEEEFVLDPCEVRQET